ncbi:O-antigen ligase family protein [Bradyrhizobium sp. SYSU BS000235]|uniref:O-antigen ligase family protein n=1 Tax=Bradyrhizobium sp. SYSU BS000235 TaxID=3411332 RepID=UPI003C720184
MTANTSSDIAVAPSLWRGPAVWARAADVFIILLAVSLPWSTSLVAVFAVLWFLTLLPTLEAERFLQSLKRPASALPLALFVLAVVGTLWSTDVPWAARLHGINPVAKLLAIPLLIYHFETSQRGFWVVLAFLGSCTLMMLTSWLIFIAPRMAFDPSRTPGVPVKNYIVQSQEFALCAFGGLGAAVYLWRANFKRRATALLVVSVAFLCNMAFVVSSRTVWVCVPFLLLVFALLHFKRRGVLIILAVAIAAGAVFWASSPYLRMRTDSVAVEYEEYHDQNASTSTGLRLEYWRKSLKFIQNAPLIGNGTGSTKTLFEKDAVGKKGVSAEIIGNPHNQTLNVAVQWGLLGCVVLYAMWLAHLKMFSTPGLISWIGLAAVVENFVSSLFNSHLFDFGEGWIYVLAVGVTGGMLSRIRGSSVGTGPKTISGSAEEGLMQP